MAVIMKNYISWGVTLRSFSKINQRFGGIYRLHSQILRINQGINQHKVDFDPDEEGEFLLRNACSFSRDYTVLYLRRYKS
jgi:hypothetical protein